MRNLLARLLRRRPPANTHFREDHRPQIASAMCSRCARRWLRGKSLLCSTCGVKLRHAFDLYFERLHES